MVELTVPTGHRFWEIVAKIFSELARPGTDSVAAHDIAWGSVKL